MTTDRKFSVHGTIYTALEYGKFMLEKIYDESNGANPHPQNMFNEEIELFAIDLLEERMTEDEDVFEISE